MGAVPPGVVDLSPGLSFSQTVNVRAFQVAGIDRIEPGNPDRSYLVRKIENAPGIAGTIMPQGCPGQPLNGALCLSADDIAAIRTWIEECAQNN